MQLTYAFVALQLKTGRARAIIRTGCVDALFAANRFLGAFVHVCKNKHSTVRLSDDRFFLAENISFHTNLHRYHRGIDIPPRTRNDNCLARWCICCPCRHRLRIRRRLKSIHTRCSHENFRYAKRVSLTLYRALKLEHEQAAKPCSKESRVNSADFPDVMIPSSEI